MPGPVWGPRTEIRQTFLPVSSTYSAAGHRGDRGRVLAPQWQTKLRAQLDPRCRKEGMVRGGFL